MNSRQYEKMMNNVLNEALDRSGISADDCNGICLSADRTEYEITLKDGSTKIIPSGLTYFED